MKKTNKSIERKNPKQNKNKQTNEQQQKIIIVIKNENKKQCSVQTKVSTYLMNSHSCCGNFSLTVQIITSFQHDVRLDIA